MKMNTNTKTDSTTTTGSNITYSSHKAEQGWECPRCGRINAPWVSQCSCTPSTYDWDKITINPCDDWWKTKITCDDNMFRIHPDSITYSTNVNTVAGGCDYKDPTTGDQVNVPKTYTNSVKR